MDKTSAHRRLWRGGVGAAVLSCTVACGNPAPDEPHWSQLLQDRLDASTQPPCWRVAFPLQVEPSQAALREPLRQMVREGLLEEHDHVEPTALSRQGRLWVPTPRFELTQKGRRYYRDDLAAAGPGVPRSGLCRQSAA